MDYKFLTCCPKCCKEFVVFWVVDPIRVGSDTVANIGCPLCGQTFWQRKGDLLLSMPEENTSSPGVRYAAWN